jgi:hypothetical protein
MLLSGNVLHMVSALHATPRSLYLPDYPRVTARALNPKDAETVNAYKSQGLCLWYYDKDRQPKDPVGINICVDHCKEKNHGEYKSATVCTQCNALP